MFQHLKKELLRNFQLTVFTFSLVTQKIKGINSFCFTEPSNEFYVAKGIGVQVQDQQPTMIHLGRQSTIPCQIPVDVWI